MDFPAFDGHNDAITRDDWDGLVTGRGGHLDLPRMRTGNVHGGIFAVFSPSKEMSWEPLSPNSSVTEIEFASELEHPEAFTHASAAAERLLSFERSGHLRVAREIEDIDAAYAENTLPTAVLHLEGAEAIDANLENLDHWYETGLRSLGPVWSRPNAFAHGVPFISPSSPDIGPGLSGAGDKLVRRCAELGILIDLSHMNEAGFWDVARINAGPLVASHSGAHHLCPASRNLTDEQLKAIGAGDGLVGIVFATEFLRPDFASNADTPLQLIVEQMRYVSELIGVEHVSLGSDFDGAVVPEELSDVAGIPRLLNALADSGFTGDEIAAIAWHNWRRVLGAWWQRR
jgi:membrane dipeptidase